MPLSRYFPLMVVSAILFIAIGALSPKADAKTASFIGAAVGDPNSISGLADATGILVGQGASIQLLLSEPFARFAANGFTPIDNQVSIFTLTDVGTVLGNLSFGRFNNGAPQFFHTQNFSTNPAGTEIDFGFLSFVGCGAAGGCDLIQLSVIDTFNGSSGVILDAVTFSNVALTAVTSATPEPGMWALMVIGFFLIAWRAKSLRFTHKSLRHGYVKPSVGVCRNSGVILAKTVRSV